MTVDTINNFLSFTGKRNEQLSEITERIFTAARPGAVFSEPVTSGNYTVITASEVASGGGFGSGIGFGGEPASAQQAGEESTATPQQPANSGGGGMGGGGGSNGRPVAVIIIGPEGVTVKPIFDATKLALAGVTTIGAMLAILRRVRKASKR